MLDLITRALEAPLVVADPLDDAPAAAIVVLGAPLARDGGLSAVVAERVAGGVALWQRGLAPRLIVTGGPTGARRAEAEVMAEAALAAGVPLDAIVVEPRARSTAENAREVARLVGPGAAVWLVTQPFHGRRARWCFRRAGLTPRVWHLADSLQYRDRDRARRWLVREYAAWARAMVVR
ncbi:MAG TPA: YdcF family protein [Kofleriaceae bacterium]|jgi:uncharacterized SAM-binding protein YcdF (DUF218 family)|nr:YdcF family protein [Kofleriaceae bacterium]